VTPGVIAYAITGRPLALLTGMLWGGLVRIFLIDHVTWAIRGMERVGLAWDVRRPSDRRVREGAVEASAS
jgi:fatty-acid desaturase